MNNAIIAMDTIKVINFFFTILLFIDEASIIFIIKIDNNFNIFLIS